MQYTSKNCALYHGDCTEVIKSIPSDSVHLIISSFPFANLYTYSDDLRDYSNVKDLEQYFKQLDYLIPELYRVTVPGRDICLHVKQIPKFKGRDGHIGLIDFRGMMIQAFQKHGWIYWDDIDIWTDPEIEALRTKASTIIYKTYRTAAENTRTGMQDILIIMKKWSDDANTHVTHGYKDDIEYEQNRKLWSKIASPCWFDINRMNVLNAKLAKDEKDEKHMTPLQLDLIGRLIEWRTNEGEIVMDPFNGVGSVTYEAVKHKRKGLGIELKQSYFEQSIKYMKELEDDSQINIFDMLES
ncbi:DNA modification methylase [Clostridium amylolyticum]|uniref:Methyltransferase n=1 Tax=Clostridium amylolyticum TaxID=1121298 RepID=A0A1M6L1N8_9CLOT|nr:DNA methyltransferase [Clostridium amylolyticum]SHJ65044.1 DNA modification methylase [Clostridium amylolyticum]